MCIRRALIFTWNPAVLSLNSQDQTAFDWSFEEWDYYYAVRQSTNQLTGANTLSSRQYLEQVAHCLLQRRMLSANSGTLALRAETYLHLQSSGEHRLFLSSTQLKEAYQMELQVALCLFVDY